MPQTSAFGAPAADQPLASLAIERREPGPRDVAIDILYCGVCHSDLHFARGEWGRHELADRPRARDRRAGQRRRRRGRGLRGRRPGRGRLHGRLLPHLLGLRGRPRAVLRERQHADLRRARESRPAGSPRAATRTRSWSTRTSASTSPRTSTWRRPRRCSAPASPPTRRCATGTSAPDSKVGVVGLGGLGHMAVKIAKAMGAEVTLFTTSPGKADDATALGADHVVISKDAEQMEAAAGTLDLIIDSVAAPHDLDPYLATLARDGSLVLLGVPPEPHPSPERRQLHPRPALAQRLADRRHRRDPGDARLLRRARRHRRRRDDLDGPDRRGLRPDGSPATSSSGS